MQIFNPSASFTRPSDTTAYTSGDLVANSTTAGSVAAVSFADQTAAIPGGVTIKRVRLVKSGTTPTNGQFRVHFYSSSPVAANGDNAAWSTSGAAGYLGSLDVTVGAFTDGCTGVGAATAGAEINARTGASSLYALIEARAAYTPASAEVFTIIPEVIESR